MMFYPYLLFTGACFCSCSMIVFPTFWRQIYSKYTVGSWQRTMWHRASDATYRWIGLMLGLFLAYVFYRMQKP